MRIGLDSAVPPPSFPGGGRIRWRENSALRGNGGAHRACPTTMSIQPKPQAAFDPAVLLRETEWLRSLARSLVSSVEEAEDLVQETWIQALRARPRGTGLRPWLRRVLRNLAISRHRRSGRTTASLGAPEDGIVDPRSAHHDPSTLVERAEIQRKLVGWLLELDGEQRDTLLMHFHGGLSPSDIASRTSLSPSTVRSRLKRGLDRLRVRADEAGGSEGSHVRVLAPVVVLPAYPPSTHLASSSLAPTLLGGAMTTKSVLGLAILTAFALFLALGRGDEIEGPEGSGADSALGARAPVAPEPTEIEGSPSDRVPPSEGSSRNPLAPDPPAGPAAPPGRPPLRGFLLHEATGRPLPAFEFSVEGARPGAHGTDVEPHGEPRPESESEIDPGSQPGADPGEDPGKTQVETLTTDRDGAFRGTARWGPGPLRFEFQDHTENHDLLNRDYRQQDAEVARRILTLDPPHPDALGSLEVPAGPSFELLFVPPPGTSHGDFLATFRCARPDQAWDRFRSPLRGIDPGPFEHPWVRFPSVAPLIQGIPPFGILLQSRDGLWEGFAEVGEHRIGHASTPVRIEVQARGRLRGRLENTAGDPINTWVILDRLEGESGPEETRFRTSPPFHEGSFEIRGIPAGRYELKATPEGHAPIRRTVEIRAGEDRILDLQFEPLGRMLPLRGTVTSTSGNYDRSMRVHAIQPSAPTRSWSTDVEWTRRRGRLEGRFRFDDLPEGLYLVEPRSKDARRIAPPRMEVELPAKRIEFDVLDEEPCFDLALELESWEDGTPIPDARVILWSEELGEAGWRAVEVAGLSGPDPRDGALLFRDVPELPDLRWRFDTAGWQGETGHVEDFSLEDGVRRGVVECRPGRSLRLRVVDASGVALAGVEVWSVGHKLGETGANGHFEVRSVGAIRSLDLHDPRNPEWRILPDGESTESEPGRIPPGAQTRTLTLGPPGD